MKLNAFLGLLLAFAGAAGTLSAQDAAHPELPRPTKEHQWLQQFVGEWETETEVFMDPSQPPMKGKGSETVRALGGFWIIGEGTGSMDGMPGTMTGIITLGYDPEKQKYIGTWVDSMTSTFWKYEGTTDAGGKKLTLHTEGPCPMKPGIVKFTETVEFKSPDHRVFTSSYQGDDGQWIKMVTVNQRRKK